MFLWGPLNLNTKKMRTYEDRKCQILEHQITDMSHYFVLILLSFNHSVLHIRIILMLNNHLKGQWIHQQELHIYVHSPIV